MKVRGVIALLIIALGAGAAYWYLQDEGAPPKPTTKYTSKHGDAITINTPKAGDRISSPLTVRGVVPGAWSFEANFPVEIVDDERKKLAEGYATVEGDWMTTKPISFTATIPFKAPASDDGFVIIRKANPAGDQATDDSVEVPVTFGPG